MHCRHIFSNGIPGHDILIPPGRPPLCETEYDIVIPLFPKYVEFPTEIPSMGPIAFTLAGIPIYSVRRRPSPLAQGSASPAYVL
eukprot:6211838-Pleurochrysis_carterae.AAC.4